MLGLDLVCKDCSRDSELGFRVWGLFEVRQDFTFLEFKVGGTQSYNLQGFCMGSGVPELICPRFQICFVSITCGVSQHTISKP